MQLDKEINNSKPYDGKQKHWAASHAVHTRRDILMVGATRALTAETVNKLDII